MGFIWVAAFSIALAVAIIVGMIGFFLFFTMLWLIDRTVLIVKSIHSRCPNCKRKSVIPVFICPTCGQEHKKLVPGPYGVMKHKCTCGTMLSTTFLGGRSGYEAHCPFCGTELLSSSSQQYGIQLVGGVGTGKTTFLAAFWHEYKDWLGHRHDISFEETPPDAFADLEEWFNTGKSESTLETNANMYSIIHTTGSKTSVQMTVYDIAGEAFDFAGSDTQQQQFRYCEGFLVVIDPTATPNYVSDTIGMPTNEIQSTLGQFQNYIQVIVEEMGVFWGTIPALLRICLVMASAVAGVNIVVSLVKAVIINTASWKKMQDSELMYSYAAGSGQFQRKLVYKDAHKFLFDKKWSWFSFAGLAYRLGNCENTSKGILFLSSLAYLPLAIMGVAEMILRAVIGVVVYFILNLSYLLLLIALWALNLVAMPLFNLVDKFSWITQHCPKCYSAFKLPVFECPHCGKHHTKLYPGRSGLLWAKCSCGHFIPCASMSKRKLLKSYCPKCDHALAGSSIKALTVQVIGGNSSGKTAFIAAFQHQYVEAIKNAGIRTVTTAPEDDFGALERMYNSGKTEKSSSNEVHTYYIMHSSKGSSDDGIVIYDVPDEIILSEQYERNPLNFAYSNGIIIIIDPLSVRSVRKECEATTGAASVNGYSNDSAEDIIVHFINKYSEVAGRTARKMSDTPVAVVIAKTDLTAIRRKVGTVKIKSEFAAKATDSHDFIKTINLFAENGIKINSLHCHIKGRGVDTWKKKAQNMVAIYKSIKNYCSDNCIIDLGGGLPALIDEHERKISIEAYVDAIAGTFKREFGGNGPHLFLESGTALAAPCMSFVTSVMNKKELNGIMYAILMASTQNTSSGKGKYMQYVKILPDRHQHNIENKTVLCGYTCLEDDIFGEVESLVETDDIVLFENTGAYSIVQKPPFIMPNFPVIEYDRASGTSKVIRKGESLDTFCKQYEFNL